MPALVTGKQAPSIELPTMDGKKFSLAESRERGPVVAVFFKISCPVCQFALPYIERIYKNYPREKVTVVAVSQDDKKQSEKFAREYGITMPIALEDTAAYTASNAYGLTNVPSTLVIGKAGEIELSSVGWSREEVEQVNRLVAAAAGVPAKPVFKPGEEVPEFTAG